MTNLQEAKLAREAEICYATLALVTDYDCWHPDHDSVTVDLIIANLLQNAATAQKTIAEAVSRLGDARTCGCKDALATAIITRPEHVPAQTKKELAPIIGKYGIGSRGSRVHGVHGVHKVHEVRWIPRIVGERPLGQRALDWRVVARCPPVAKSRHRIYADAHGLGAPDDGVPPQRTDMNALTGLTRFIGSQGSRASGSWINHSRLENGMGGSRVLQIGLHPDVGFEGTSASRTSCSCLSAVSRNCDRDHREDGSWFRSGTPWQFEGNGQTLWDSSGQIPQLCFALRTGMIRESDRSI